MLLPQPDGPTIAYVFEQGTSKEISFSKGTSFKYWKLTLSNLIVVVLKSGFRGLYSAFHIQIGEYPSK